MTQKEFIKTVALELLSESDPRLGRQLGLSPSNSDTNSEDLLSPTAAELTPATRFFCTKEAMASITKSKKYK